MTAGKHLTDKQRERIMVLRRQGVSLRDIGQQFGLAPNSASKIINRVLAKQKGKKK